MKIISRGPKEQLKKMQWLAILWVISGLLYLLAAALRKNDRNFHVAMSIMYFILTLLSLFSARRLKNKISKSKGRP
jgi:hypothetical protein